MPSIIRKMVLTLALCALVNAQECIEDFENQFFTSNLGDLSWDIADKTGISESSVEFIDTQCQDGGYVHCISTSIRENGDGISTLGSIQYSCSNGYVSPVFGDKDSNGVFECASMGIHGAFADLNFDVVTDGGFEATDSSGNDRTLSEWGGDGGGISTRISCESGEYMIGLELSLSFYDGVDNLWGFRLMCSSQEVCPQTFDGDDDFLATAYISEKTLSGGEIAGIVIGTIVGLAAVAIVLAIYFGFICRYKSKDLITSLPDVVPVSEPVIVPKIVVEHKV